MAEAEPNVMQFFPRPNEGFNRFHGRVADLATRRKVEKGLDRIDYEGRYKGVYVSCIQPTDSLVRGEYEMRVDGVISNLIEHPGKWLTVLSLLGSVPPDSPNEIIKIGSDQYDVQGWVVVARDMIDKFDGEIRQWMPSLKQRDRIPLVATATAIRLDQVVKLDEFPVGQV